jgi:hypothetical protein
MEWFNCSTLENRDMMHDPKKKKEKNKLWNSEKRLVK